MTEPTKTSPREVVARWEGNTALDNYDPTPRRWASVDLEEYAPTDYAPRTLWLIDASELRDANHAVYLIDDGRRVEAFYVAGWGGIHHPTGVILHPMPTNYDADGTRRLRADDGRPVDYSYWSLGPRRCYHLKVTRVGELREVFGGSQ